MGSLSLAPTSTLSENESTTITETSALWTPNQNTLSELNIEVFRKAVNEKYGLSLGNCK